MENHGPFPSAHPQTTAIVSRLSFVDWLRGGSVLYIVGFWHMLEYAPGVAFNGGPGAARLTVVVLGLFIFLSGFLLGSRPLRLCWKDLGSFYRRRLLRIYPLYLATLVLFVAVGLTVWSAALKAAVGASMLCRPSPPTLWFVAMLLCYYVIAPLLIASAAKQKNFAAAAGGLFVGIVLIVWLLPDADNRIATYFPAFAAGVYWARRGKPASGGLTAGLIMVAVVVLTASIVLSRPGLNFLLVAALAGLGPMALFAVCERHQRWLPALRIVQAVSYAGFVMYLVHRPVFMTLTSLYLPSSGVPQAAYLVGFCLPLLVALSWMIQQGYDRLLPARQDTTSITVSR